MFQVDAYSGMVQHIKPPGQKIVIRHNKSVCPVFQVDPQQGVSKLVLPVDIP